MAHMVIYKHIMMTSSNRSISTLLALCVGNSPVTDEFPAQRPLMRSFDVFCDLRLDNGWVNNCEVGDWRRHRTHYDVIMICCIYLWGAQSNSTVCAFSSLQSWILCSIMKYVFFSDHIHSCKVYEWRDMFFRFAEQYIKSEHCNDDVTKSKHFPRYWPFVSGHRWIRLIKKQWRGTLMFLWPAPEHSVAQAIKTPVIWSAIALIMTSL